MLTYNMDVTPESVWKRTTPSEAELAQPYYCTEAGVFYAQQHFSTARTDKESYILFYTLRGAGLIEQGESHVVLSTGQALLLNCRTPQSYCTAPGQSCWHHYWVHLDGAGVAAMEPLLLPDVRGRVGFSPEGLARSRRYIRKTEKLLMRLIASEESTGASFHGKEGA